MGQTGSDARHALALSANDRIAVVAGSGLLPKEVADGLVKAGYRPLVVAIEGEADLEDEPSRYDFLRVTHEELGKLLSILKRRGVTHMVLAGGVARRPPLSTVRYSPKILLHLPRLAAGYARGDDGLLRAIAGFINSYGIKLVGAHEVVPELLAPQGQLTKMAPTRADERDISAAIAAARAIGRLDIGQAAVAVGGRTIALEDIEGTDGLLRRARVLRSHGRLAGKSRGVLVKCAKPGQELRVDLPTIGPQTVRDAHEAGLAGIAVEAERSLILECGETVRLADEFGLYLLGFARGREQ
ncbi:UDP-2,3-diacylglucosamine diphosphatase LpxI [Chelativorans sp. AA-79]|uniref:LpxI family protein n=1 Tax=Chelativorans sp. AA-79 TaxID=3028735 RepID=UPI0023F782D1|nr:UDP-2,3-diacylglucosamine diphosphatase LpxI [Chelativorans sp. AA-79]WEX07047.1 UDP-2,3-diacylglucosamine diphosphatase LpxI [Chelativorans sp. AA-79]